MPHFVETSSSGSSDAESTQKTDFDAQRIVSDAEYAGAHFPGSSEVPLSDQLEPIAVVGMGKIAPPCANFSKVNSLSCRVSPSW